MTSSTWLVVPMLGVLFASADALAGSKEDARAHVAKATRAHKESRYEDARVELDAAYALDPRPDVLYAIGQVEAKLGRCDEATEHYRRFAATQSDPRVARVVEEAISACVPAEPARGAARAEPAVASPSAAPEQRTTAAAPVQPERWYRDPVGGALVGGGAVAAILALVEYRSALSDLDTAGDRATTTSLARYHERVDSAHHKRTTALVLAGAGAALISAGVVRYVLHSRTLEAHEVAVVPARGGGIVSFGGRF